MSEPVTFSTTELFYKKYSAKLVFDIRTFIRLIEEEKSFVESIPKWYAKSNRILEKTAFIQLSKKLTGFDTFDKNRFNYIIGLIDSNWSTPGKGVCKFFQTESKKIIKKKFPDLDFMLKRSGENVSIFVDHKHAFVVKDFFGTCKEIHVPKSDSVADAIKDLSNDMHNVIAHKLYYGKYRYRLSYGWINGRKSIDNDAINNLPWRNFQYGYRQRISKNKNIKYCKTRFADNPHCFWSTVSQIETLSLSGKVYVLDSEYMNIYFEDEQDAIMAKLASIDPCEAYKITLVNEIE